MTDRMTTLYHQELARPESPLLEINLNTGEFPFIADIGHKYLARPLFFGEDEFRRFGDALLAVVDLLMSLPERVFGGDVERVCQALGLDMAKARLIGSFEESPPRFGRIDAYHDGCSIRVLEFNASSGTGALEWAGTSASTLLKFDAFRAFAGKHGLRYVDTTALLVQALRDVGATASSGHDPVIALIEGPGGMAIYGEDWVVLRQLIKSYGLECHLGEIADLHVRNGRVFFGAGQAPVDVLYRLFDLDQVIHDPQALAMAGQLRDLSRDGKVAFWTPLETELHKNKRWMAYLSDPRLRLHLSDHEKRLVDSLLPWTRALTPTSATDDRELLEICRERREHLILKPDEGFGLQGITCGWRVDDPAWAAALHEAQTAGAVVQERVVPRQEPVFNPVTRQTEPWDSCLGLFWLPSGLAGGGARLVPTGQPFTLDPERRRLAGIYLYPEAPGTASPEQAGSGWL
jgi:hypothetical protein